jgi:DNA polymerase I-like protein with 3'-5' exonuclease and polymerase domains
LIKPAENRALAYVDWSQQELGIAAALSGDEAMMLAYRSGDPYLEFAKQAGAVPPDATKETHPEERNRFKICSLGVQYGMQAQGLAQSLGGQLATARNLLRMHHETYRTFWRWSQLQTDKAMIQGWIQTVFGWRYRTSDISNPRSLANFPTQANGAEMMRLACCLATEAGIQVCAPVHDAILVEGPLDGIDEVVRQTQEIMAAASSVVLRSLELTTDAEVVRWPDRYMDEGRGRTMWDRVMALVRRP